MKRHALFLATALAAASLGTAGLAMAQPVSTGPAAGPATDAARDAPRAWAKGEHPRHGRRHSGHRGGGIERMDADGDGRVSRAEFDAAKAARDEARQAREGKGRGSRMALDFDAIDANSDGYVVRAEVRTHREQMRQRMHDAMQKRFVEAFAAADLNGDGRLSRVEIEEKMPRLSSRFAWMDDNRDGFLDRAELEAGKRR